MQDKSVKVRLCARHISEGSVIAGHINEGSVICRTYQ